MFGRQILIKKIIVSVRHSAASIFIHSFMKADKLYQNIQGHNTYVFGRIYNTLKVYGLVLEN